MLPPGRAGQWTRVILGSGTMYRKQIGLGVERAPARAPRLYVETQVGVAGGPWNPSSLRKAYVRGSAFGSLVRAYPTVTNLGFTATAIYRYGEPTAATLSEAATGETMLHLLDEPWVYDSRPLRIVSAAPERIESAGAVHDTIHVVASYGAKQSAHERLERIDLWHSSDFPFGVARYRATLRGLERFELRVTAHGDAFATQLPVPLDAIPLVARNVVTAR
jgi:hypothetical protein